MSKNPVLLRTIQKETYNAKVSKEQAMNFPDYVHSYKESLETFDVII